MRMRSQFEACRNALRILVFSVLTVSTFGQESRKLIANPVPVYPQLAKRDGLTGTVKVEVTVAPDGHIKETRVMGGSPLFVSSTLDTLKTWRYAPSSQETTTILEFHFRP
jgi:TonB family protein